MITPEYLHELTDLCAVVLGHQDLPSALEEVCRIAVRSVPGAEGASLTTYQKGQPSALASDEWAKGLDEMQYEEHEGPCLDATRSGNAFRIRDFNEETRWPFYGPRALANGAVSMVSIPCSSEGRIIGALNLYSPKPDTFDATAVALAEVVAAHAGLASQVSAAFYHQRDLAGQLAEAIKSRAEIEQAKGILMGQRNCSADEAFSLLVKLSQESHRKLRDVAIALIEHTLEP
jgi:transcriptional regulator with GAF, ATPase, and Fis domain